MCVSQPQGRKLVKTETGKHFGADASRALDKNLESNRTRESCGTPSQLWGEPALTSLRGTDAGEAAPGMVFPMSDHGLVPWPEFLSYPSLLLPLKEKIVASERTTGRCISV